MANATQDDIAVQQKRLAALDQQLASYHGDHNGRLDLRQASVRAATEIARLSGPQRPLQE